MTFLVLDPGEGAVKLLVGFFRLFGILAELLTSKSGAANVAGILLAISPFVLFGWYLARLHRKGAKARSRRGGTRARSNRRGKKEAGAGVLESRHDPSGRSSMKNEPEPPDGRSTAASKPDDTQQPVRTYLGVSPSAPHDVQSEADTESAMPADDGPDKRASP